MKIELSHDWSEFLSALISRRVQFVLVGGHAVAGHAEPRLTEDLDVFVARMLANARRLRQALVDGLRPLRLAGVMKVAEGLTTLDEVLRATPAWEA